MMFATTLLALMTFCFFSCSSDDEDEQHNGSHNTTDVAVTGNVTNLGVSYAYICGYVNLHLITTSYSSQQIGIELSESEDFYYSQETRTRELEGNKLTVMVENLNAHTKYYYRTFVKVNDLKYYGEKRSFKTKDFTNITSTGNVVYLSSSSATIKCKVDTSSIDHNNKYVIGVAYSGTKSKLQTDSVYVGGWTGFYTQSIRLNDIEKDTYFITISGLQANATYYYCSYTYAGGKYKLGDIKSFTTTEKDDVIIQQQDYNSLEGTWRGNMSISTYYGGRTYYATHTEITFTIDPFRFTKGSGYWVDYYSGAPWDYVANHITWLVNNGNITINFIEDHTSLVISNYNLIDSHFTGYIADGDKEIHFSLTHTSTPNWDDYDYWGYDGWSYSHGYYSRQTRAIGGDRAGSTKRKMYVDMDTLGLYCQKK